MSERDRSPPDAGPAAPATPPSKRGGGRGGFTLSLKGRALRLLTGDGRYLVSAAPRRLRAGAASGQFQVDLVPGAWGGPGLRRRS
jgi:hypothetical protein